MIGGALRHVLIGGLLASGVVVTGVAVTTSSYSVFSASTSNPTSNWNSGAVALTNDATTNTAMFSASGLKPGSTGTRCLVVTSSGTVPSIVKLYGTSYSAQSTASTNLANAINLVVTQGTGGSFSGGCGSFVPLSTGSAVYTGTLANFGATATQFSSGLPASGSWAPTGSGTESRVYQIQYTVDPNATNSAQSGSVAVAFTWEAQSN